MIIFKIFIHFANKKLNFLQCLTIAGNVISSNGRFRPYFLAKIPANNEPNTIPTDFNDVIHDACVTVILPVGNGDLYEVSKNSAGLGQPFIMPKCNPINDTVRKGKISGNKLMGKAKF